MTSSPGLLQRQHQLHSHHDQQQQLSQQQPQHQEHASLPPNRMGDFRYLFSIDQTGNHSVDPSLQSIAAFNASYDDAHEPTPTNQWGKRPADHEISTEVVDDIAAKRQHLEVVQTLEAADQGDGQNLSQMADAGFAARTDAGDHFVEQQRQQQLVENDQMNADEEEPEGLGNDYEMSDEEEEDRSGVAQYGGDVDQSYMLWDANRNLRIHSLPILDNLSSQILTTLGKGPYQETLNIVTQPDSDQGQAYSTMKTLFDHTKKLYTQEAFLSADELKLEHLDQRATIRRVNLATFVSSVFGSQEVGFFHLNEHFLETFVPDNGRLLKSQGALYLDLKTQAYISAMSTNERAKEEILGDLFPDEMREILLNRRSGAKQLSPSESDFVARLAQRKQHLMVIPDDTILCEKYVWQDFLKEVSWYVSKNYQNFVTQPLRRPKKRKTPPGQLQRTLAQTQQQGQIQIQASMADGQATRSHSQQISDSGAQSGHQSPVNGQSISASQLALDVELFGSNTSIAMSLGAPPPQLAAPQSAPTQVLYERARMAATAKASPNARRAGLPSQRRPWTTEEENALMAGLDRVKGPHWSQILALFGPGGTISEVLKDRNQVQLKDKARNLKLFFLKSNIEVPYYLQFVTGELKTRAPGQALRNAAKKAVESSADEDAAHVAAVTALGQVRNNSAIAGQGGSPGHLEGMAPMADMGMGGANRFKLPNNDDVEDRVDPALMMQGVSDMQDETRENSVEHAT